MNASILNQLLHTFLPPDIAAFIQTHILDSRSPFQVILSQILLQIRNVSALVAPLLDRLLAQAGVDLSGFNIAGVVAAAALVLTVLAVLDYIRRTIMWWARFTFRVLFWAIAMAIAAVVWERGVLESGKDAVVWGGKLLGYLAGVKDVWMQEYERYERQQQQPIMGGGRGRSSGR